MDQTVQLRSAPDVASESSILAEEVIDQASSMAPTEVVAPASPAPRAADWSESKLVKSAFGLPLWAYALFGVVVSSLAVCMFLLTTRCPCEGGGADDDGEEEGHSPPTADVVGDLYASSFILVWAGSIAPPSALKIHFLSTSQLSTTFSCDAQSVFGTHERVRVALPKGEYMCRAVFADGTQHVCEASRAHSVATVTENSLACRALVHGDETPGRPLPSGACVRSK